MAITNFFTKIGAPLKNQRWSWGAVRDSDGCVILRVWSDELQIIEGKRFARITWFDKFVGKETRPGFRERMAQIELIKHGSPSAMVICDPLDENPILKRIKSFNDRAIFKGGLFKQIDGDWWLELTDQIPVDYDG